MLKQISFLTLFSLTVSSAAVAQDSALELFSKDVDIVLRLAEPDKSIESLVELVNAAQPGFGEIARGAVNENLGKAISNPGLVGVDQSRDWHVGIFGQGKNEPLVVFAIPAVETADVVGALGDSFSTHVQGKFVLYTDKGELPAVPSAADSLAKALEGAPKSAFELGEVSLYVNSKHLVQEYETEIDTAYDQVLEGLNQLRFAIPQDTGVNMGPIIEMYGTMAEKIFQGVRDSQSLVVAIDFGKEGVRVEEYLEFGSRTESAKVLAELKASSMSDLKNLPRGASAYYGASGGLKEMIKWSMDLTASMSEDESTQETLKNAFGDLDDVELGAMVGSFTIGSAENGLIQSTNIARATPVSKFKEYMRASVSAMKEIKMPGMTQTSTLKEDAETYGDHKVDVVNVVQEYDQGNPQAELQQKMQTMMFGPNGIETRILYLDDKYITVMGGGKEAAKATFENLEESENEAVAEPRKILMENLNFLGLIDVPGMVANGLKAASEMDEFPLPLDAGMINSLGLQESYLGFGVAVEDNALRCRTDVPIEQIQGIFKISMLFVGMRNQL